MICTPLDEITRVKMLLKSIISKDIIIISSITVIRENTSKLSNFDEMSDFLIITAPLPNAIENSSQNISAINVNTGKTGIEIRYFKRDSFSQLSD